MTAGAISGRRRSGFTLIELLVVIGIILIIISIVLPSVNKAWNSASRSRMEADLQTISTGLEAYRADFRVYPPVPTGSYGYLVLCQALLNPNPSGMSGVSGKPEFGFQNRTGGKVWGPYVNPDSIKYAAVSSGYELIDRYKNPILYYPGKQGVDITQPGGYLGPNGMFNPSDNSTYLTAQKFQILMGDGGYDNGSGTATTSNGGIEGTEKPAYEGPYVLWSAGPDQVYGQNPPDNTKKSTGATWRCSPVNPCDDVANFPRSPY